MPNIFTGTINASAPTNALAGTSSGLVVAENNNRVGLTIVNVSGSTVYLAMQGMTATLHAGLAIAPNGGAWTMEEYTFTTGQINAIAHSAGNILCVQEFVR